MFENRPKILTVSVPIHIHEHKVDDPLKILLGGYEVLVGWELDFEPNPAWDMHTVARFLLCYPGLRLLNDLE